MVERFNRTLLQHLSKVVDEHREDWHHYIPRFMLAYRSSVHESAHHTPVKIIFDHELRPPCNWIWNTTRETNTYQWMCHGDEKSLKNIHNCEKPITSCIRWIKTRYDIRANSTGFSVGDHVWLYNTAHKKRHCFKLQQDWGRPYVILKLNDVVCRIQKPSNQFKVIHVDWLASWNGDHNINHGTDKNAQP